MRSWDWEMELYYGFQASPGLTLKPLAQYIVHPGGRRSAPDALILGLCLELDL